MKLLTLKPLTLRPFPASLWARSRKRLVARRKARVAVLTAVAAALLAHVGLAVVVETRRPHWRDPEYFLREKRLADVRRWSREGGHAHPLVVVVGGSRPQMGLAPEFLLIGSEPTDPFAFDLVQSGTIPVGVRLNLARMFAAGITPEYALIEVLPAVLADPGPMEERIPVARLGYADLVRLRPYHDDPGRAAARWASARAASWYTLRVPLLSNWGLSRALPAGRERADCLWADMRFYGWSPFYTHHWPAERRAAGLEAARGPYTHWLSHFQIAPVNDRAYRDMLTECRARGVRAALFVMPESPTFRSWYTPAAREQLAAYLGELSREFGVPVFDASAWVDDEGAFSDGHHLLGPAAVEFSLRFARECLEPWVRGTPPPPPR